MHLIFVVLLTLLQTPASPPPSLPLEIHVVEKESGRPVPNASVLWLDAVTHLEHRHRLDPEWPADPLRAVQQFGRSVQCDEAGHIILDASFGGAYVAVQGAERFAFQVIPSGTRSVTLEAEVDVTLTVQVLDPEGLPITGVRTWISAPNRTRRKSLDSATTDSDGLAVYPHAQHNLLTAEDIARANVEQADLLLHLDVVGGDPIQTAITGTHFNDRLLHLRTPTLGYIEILTQEDPPSLELSGRIFFLEEHPHPMEGGSRSMSSRQSLRVAAPLGLQFQATAKRGSVVTTTQHQFTGPRSAHELVQVGPLYPVDHTAITIVSGLAPDEEFPDPQYLSIYQRDPGNVWPRERAGLTRPQIRPDGSFEILVPNGFCSDPSFVLEVVLRGWGLELAHGIVRGGPRDNGRYEIVSAEPHRLRRADLYGLIPGQAAVERPSSPVAIAGSVTDSNGNPVPFAKVEVAQDNVISSHEAWERPEGISLRDIRCDRQGRFEARFSTRARRLRVAASAPGLGLHDPVFCKPGDTDLCIQIAPRSGGREFFRSSYTNFTHLATRDAAKEISLLSADGEPFERCSFRVRVIEPPTHEKEAEGHNSRSGSKAFGRVGGWHSVRSNLLGQIAFPAGMTIPAGSTIEAHSLVADAPLLYGKLEWGDAPDRSLAITLSTKAPALEGRLLDETGEPIEGTRLRIVTGPEATADHPHWDHRTRCVTDAEGRFELHFQPTSSGLGLELDSGDNLRFAAPRTYAFGEKNLDVVALRLGRVQAELQLPLGATVHDLQATIISAEGGDPIPHTRSRISDVLAIEKLDPGQYRLTLAFSGRSPVGSRLAQPTTFYRSPSFTVSGGGTTQLPSIQLKHLFRVVQLHTTYEGDRIEFAPEHFGIRHTRPSQSLSWRLSRFGRLLLARNPTVELGSRGIFQVNGESLALQTAPMALPPNVAEFDLELERSPARVLQIDPSSMILAMPYSLQALLHPGDPSSATPWQFSPSRREAAESWVKQVQPDGRLILPRRPAMPGEFEPDRLVLALGYAPEGTAPQRIGRDFERLYRGNTARPEYWPPSTSSFFDPNRDSYDPTDPPKNTARGQDRLWLEALILPTPSNPLPSQPHLREFEYLQTPPVPRPACQYYTIHLPPPLYEPIPLTIPPAILEAAHKRMEER